MIAQAVSRTLCRNENGMILIRNAENALKMPDHPIHDTESAPARQDHICRIMSEPNVSISNNSCIITAAASREGVRAATAQNGMNYYVDMHAGLLPGMADTDGRILPEQEAAERLAEYRESNMKMIVAAPYYQPEVCSPQEFLEMRSGKIAAITEEAQPIRIVGGAVLPFDYCTAHPRELKQFALGDSDFILVDLPREPLSETLCEEISRLRIVSGLCPVAADIDRCFEILSPEELIALRKAGILLQISVSGILRQDYRKLSLYLLANQHAHFLATGSHAFGEPLHFVEAMRIIQRSLPAQLYRRIKNNAGMLLSNAEPSAFLE